MSASRKAILALTACTLIWGSTFFLTKWALDAFAAATGADAGSWAVCAAFLGLRFAAASACLLLLLPGAARGLRSLPLWRDAGAIALPTAAGFALQTLGLAHVSPATSAFLTSLYVPLTPVAGWLLFRNRLNGALGLALCLALSGLWILTPPTSPAFGRGEALSALCGAAFGFQIVLIDRVTRRQDTGAITLALFLLMAAVFLGTAGTAWPPRVLGHMRAEPAAWLPLLFLGTVGTLLPFWAMNRFQRDLDANHAAVVYASEPVFAAAFSALCFGERFGMQALAGGVLVIAANLWAGRVALKAPTGPAIIPPS